MPLLRCLPVGFSWSLFFAQEFDEEAVSDVLRRVLLLQSPRTLYGTQPRSELAVRLRRQRGSVIGSNEGVVTQRMGEVVESVERRRLKVPRARTERRSAAAHARSWPWRVAACQRTTSGDCDWSRHVLRSRATRHFFSVFCASNVVFRPVGETFLPLWPTVAAELQGVPRQPLGVAF